MVLRVLTLLHGTWGQVKELVRNLLKVELKGFGERSLFLKQHLKCYGSEYVREFTG